MSSLLLYLSTQAAALPLDLDREIAHRELILHGLVGKQQQCLSTDGRDAFTFLELLPRTSLLGPLPSSSFWIQRLGGTFPDGSVAAPYGQPLLSPGEEVVVLLDYSEDGSPDLLSDPSHGLYRVIALEFPVEGEWREGEDFGLDLDYLKRAPRSVTVGRVEIAQEATAKAKKEAPPKLAAVRMRAAEGGGAEPEWVVMPVRLG